MTTQSSPCDCGAEDCKYCRPDTWNAKPVEHQPSRSYAEIVAMVQAVNVQNWPSLAGRVTS